MYIERKDRARDQIKRLIYGRGNEKALINFSP